MNHLKSESGFTLIEVIAALLLLSAVIIVSSLTMSLKGKKPFSSSSKIEKDASEVRCVEGYKFISSNGQNQQILNVDGGGIRCGE